MSRAYDISDFAAFLRKYGDSRRDSESRKEEPSRDASQRTRPDRGRNQESTLSRNGYDRSRTIYHGLVKPKEARHDADLYRLYHKVAREIADVGGKVRRVVLDYELKQELYRKLSRVDPNKELAYERIRVANEYDLKVVNDKIPVPDLRIEYEDECRELRRLDLEIATRDYRPQGLAEKAQAGFHLFARQQDHAKLRRVLDTQEITARIFAL